MPNDAIPADGRDVQCSNCGQTWFATHEQSSDDEKPAEPPRATKVHVRKRAEYPPQERAELSDTAAPRQPVKEDVKRVLRQEADRERKARQADADASLEVQEELGLDTPKRATQDFDTVAPRKSRLPDIEEINSTLASTPMPRRTKTVEPQNVDTQRQRHGFRLGFVLALFILAILTGLYSFAPNLTEMFPQFADQVNSYVFWINDIRQLMFTTTERLLNGLQSAEPATQ